MLQVIEDPNVIIDHMATLKYPTRILKTLNNILITGDLKKFWSVARYIKHGFRYDVSFGKYNSGYSLDLTDKKFCYFNSNFKRIGRHNYCEKKQFHVNDTLHGCSGSLTNPEFYIKNIYIQCSNLRYL
jgi:hypothetical protein